MADVVSATAPAKGGQLQLPQTMVAHDGIEEVINDGTKERLSVEAHFLESKPMIHRFPSNLQRISRERDYIVPRTVAIGPYYHGMPELQPMEKVKRTVTNYFFEGLAQSRDATYEKIKSISRDARSCYTDEDVLKGITDDEFAEMMFIDGCFLVQFIETMLQRSGGASLTSIINPHTKGVWRDMMLLENQIPWALMEVLMPLKSLTMEHILVPVVTVLHGTVSDIPTEPFAKMDYKPGHLLCFIRFYEAASKRLTRPSSSNVLPLDTSAVGLSEMGIKLEPSQKMQFSAMDLVKGPFFGKLFLPPLRLGAIIKCWLVNMAAFEMCTETYLDHDCSVNSYLSVLSLLMNREEDVRELRVKRILHGRSSDRQILEFFNDLVLVPGQAYARLIPGLAEYRQKRRVWIAIYRFLYKNAKTIVTILSITGLLVGIFKALYSLKH
ncbi:hypothetical protein EJB05_26174, partial [Eragrostis curvula]